MARNKSKCIDCKKELSRFRNKKSRCKECNLKFLSGDNHWTRRVGHKKETIEKMRESRKKQIITEEHKRKISESKKGSKNPSWKGGISPLRKIIQQTKEYKLWRIAVFERDNYTCIWCKQKGGRLNADHIKKFADYPELRFAIDNGRTLCEPCHRTTDTYGNKKIKYEKN